MDADVVVVGVGTAGSAVLWRLAARGIKVIGVEQFEPGHDRGSGHGESRIIRTAYHEHPAYVPLVREAWRLWRSLERESGAAVLTRTGALMIGPSGGELLRGVASAIGAHDLDHEWLDAEACGRRFPQHRLAPTEEAVFEPDAGFLRPEPAIRTMAARATVAGAVLLTGRRVGAVEPVSRGVRVALDDEAIIARHAIVCAGPWVAGLLPALREKLQVERQVQAWLPVHDAALYGAERFPVFIRERAGHFLYGVPAVDGKAVKVGIHHEGAAVDPDAIDRRVRDADLSTVSSLVAALLDGVNPVPSHAAVCMYTNAPDGHFVIGRVSGLGNVTVVSACSGHGFKFAPVVGEIAADLALDGNTARPIALFDPSRLLA